MRAIAIGFLPVIVMVLVGCHDYKVKSEWVSQPLTVDGNPQDWEQIKVLYDDYGSVTLGIANDSENCYLLCIFTDAKILRALRERGFTIWMDTTGRENCVSGLTYRGDLPAPNLSKRMERRNSFSGASPQGAPPFLQNIPADKILYVEVEKRFQTILPADGSQGPRACLENQNRAYCYEFSLPLSKPVEGVGLGTQPGKTISLGFQFGSALKGKTGARDQGPPRNAIPGDGGGPGPSGPGGPPGVGGGPGGGGKPPGASFVKTTIWVKVRLAQPTVPSVD